MLPDLIVVWMSEYKSELLSRNYLPGGREAPIFDDQVTRGFKLWHL